MDVWMYGWMYGCMDVWMYGCMDVWMYGCMYVCMCVYIHIYIERERYTHTHTYTHIYIYKVRARDWGRWGWCVFRDVYSCGSRPGDQIKCARFSYYHYGFRRVLKHNLNSVVYIYIYIVIYISYVYMYIYIYIEREREMTAARPVKFLMSMGNVPQSLTQAMPVGVILVGRLGVVPSVRRGPRSECIGISRKLQHQRCKCRNISPWSSVRGPLESAWDIQFQDVGT